MADLSNYEFRVEWVKTVKPGKDRLQLTINYDY